MIQLSSPVTVLAVEGKTITTKKGPGVIYEVSTSDNRKYSTFLQPLAQKASSLQGQTVTVSFNERQNGQYVNYDLEGIFAANENPPAVDVVAVAAPIPVAGVIAPPIPVAPPVNADLRDLKIQRQAAQRTAAIFVSNLYSGAGPELLHEAIGNMRKLVADLLEHTAGGEWAGGITVPAVSVPDPVVQAASSQNASGIEW